MAMVVHGSRPRTDALGRFANHLVSTRTRCGTVAPSG